MPAGSGLITLFPMILLLGLLWWMSRSQKKQQRQRQEQLDSLKVGDNVVTIGGLHGVISEIDKEKGTVTLDCEGIYLEFDRQAIKTSKPVAAAPAKAAKPTSVVDSKTIEATEKSDDKASAKADTTNTTEETTTK